VAERLRLELAKPYFTDPVVAWSVIQLMVAEVAVFLVTVKEVMAGGRLGSGAGSTW